MAFSPDDAAFVCRQFGIDVDRPLITQVSRFDPWKDPIGVIDAYREVKEEVPEAQLALVGSMATDDPEGWDFFHATFEYADGDPDIKILNNLNNVGAIEVNAFQSQSDVVLQKSIREGFGLTVTEALWKGRPIIAGNVGGIPLQIEDGVCGLPRLERRQCAQRCLEILRDPELGRSWGGRARSTCARVPLAAPAARLPARSSTSRAGGLTDRAGTADSARAGHQSRALARSSARRRRCSAAAAASSPPSPGSSPTATRSGSPRR